MPREGISREDYLTTKFGSVEAYKGIAGRVVAAASEEGLVYKPELVARQPNTTDCHRLILWAEAIGKAPEMKQRLMELYFRDGGDLTDVNVLVQAAADVGLDADDVRKRLATDEDVARVSARCAGGRREGHLRRADLCVRAEIRRLRRAAIRTCSPAPSARCRRRSTRRRRSSVRLFAEQADRAARAPSRASLRATSAAWISATTGSCRRSGISTSPIAKRPRQIGLIMG